MISFNVFVPEKNVIVHMEEGAADYIAYSIYDLEDMVCAPEEGVMMVKGLVSELYKKPETCISDVLKSIYDRVPEHLILERDTSHLAILNIVDEEDCIPLLVKYRGEKPDAKDRILAAVQYAEEDGYRGDYLSIPEYLKKAELTVIPTTVHTIHNTSFGPKKEYEKAKNHNSFTHNGALCIGCFKWLCGKRGKPDGTQPVNYQRNAF